MDPIAVGTYAIQLDGGDQFTVDVLVNYYAQTELANYRSIEGQTFDLGDDSVAELTAPFPLSFGGAKFDKLFVSSNGTVSLSRAFGDYYNRYMPLNGAYTPHGWDRTVATLIAPLWDDLFPVKDSDQNVFWDVLGTAPNRELVIEWRNVRFYDCNSETDTTTRFEIIFEESSNDILYEYANVSSQCTGFDRGTNRHAHGASATVGLQIDPSAGSTWSINNEKVAAETAIRWRLVTDAVAPNPVPILSLLVPRSVPVNAPGAVITVQGSQFVPGAQLLFQGMGRATTFISSTQLQATLHDTDTFASGLWQVTVRNPGPGGGESNWLDLGVGITPPLITALSPASVTAGSPSFTLKITGDALTSSSPYVSFNGHYRDGVHVSDTEVDTTILASDVATPGVFDVLVGGGPGGYSNALQFTVNPKSGVLGSTFLSYNGHPQPGNKRVPDRFLGWLHGQHLAGYTKEFSERVYGRAWQSADSTLSSRPSEGSSSGALGLKLHNSMPAGFIPTGVVTGDFNHDRKVDWAVCNGGDSNVWIYFGNGDGTAVPPRIVSLIGFSPTAIAVAHLRGIGQQDLIVGEGDSLAVEVLLGNGDGTFTSAGQQYVPGAPTSLVLLFAMIGLACFISCGGGGAGGGNTYQPPPSPPPPVPVSKTVTVLITGQTTDSRWFRNLASVQLTVTQ